MEKQDSYVFLEFHIKILSFFRLWPTVDQSPGVSPFRPLIGIMLIMFPVVAAIMADCILMIYGPGFQIVQLVEGLIAVAAILGAFYIAICYLINKYAIKVLVARIAEFQRFTSFEGMKTLDAKATLYFKVLFVYYIIGCGLYNVLPYMTIKSCDAHRSEYMIMHGIPCGLISRMRLPFKFDYVPLHQLAYLNEAAVTYVSSGVIVMFTSLLCSILMHVTYNVQQLKVELANLSKLKPNELKNRVNFCVEYHNRIISYCDDMNAAFKSQMFLHITLTSFLISILGYQLLHSNLADCIRFTCHLLGWFCLLFSICYYGQTLHDESIGVAEVAYGINWYKAPINVQKNIAMIIMRSQKPLMLSAVNVGFMTFPTFLKVLKSAYSYFALLVNLN